jgi:hypothetical protein
MTGPTRLDTKAFKTLQQAEIQPQSTRAFVDCLMDGFNTAHWMTTNIVTRQQRRSDSFRVEAMTNSVILVSADVFDSGRVQLLESISAKFIDTRGEQKSFSRCIQQLNEQPKPL